MIVEMMVEVLMVQKVTARQIIRLRKVQVQIKLKQRRLLKSRRQTSTNGLLTGDRDYKT